MWQQQCIARAILAAPRCGFLRRQGNATATVTVLIIAVHVGYDGATACREGNRGCFNVECTSMSYISSACITYLTYLGGESRSACDRVEILLALSRDMTACFLSCCVLLYDSDLFELQRDDYESYCAEYGEYKAAVQNPPG